MMRIAQLLTVCLAVTTTPTMLLGQSNLVSSVGLGAVLALGESENVIDDGYTVRGQVGKSFGLVSVHGQTGWTRLLAATDGLAEEDLDLWHVGAGGRIGFGPLFAGVNAFYNFGDTNEDGFDLVPEAGLRFWRLEFVSDVRFDHWVAFRLGYVF